MARFFPMKKEDFDNLFPEHQEPLNPIIGLKILNPPNKTTYTEGDVFDPTGMSVALEHKDGTTDDITNRISYVPKDILNLLNNYINISYDNYNISQRITVESKSKIYGAYWDGSETQQWVRTDAAKDFPDPIAAINNGTGSSPFDNIYPWAGMKRVTDPEAGELVSIPKFYFTLNYYNNSQGLAIKISDEPFENSMISPAHMDRGDGQGERDVVYVGRYHCSSNTYKSETNSSSFIGTNNNSSLGERHTLIHNLGNTIYHSDYAMRVTIWLLYLVEYAHWNSQQVIGTGGFGDSSNMNTGLTDSMKYHTGTSGATRNATSSSVQYRYIENLWGVNEFIEGIYINKTRNNSAYKYNLNIEINPDNFAFPYGNGISVLTDINSTFSEAANNCIKSMQISSLNNYEWILYPSDNLSQSDSNYQTYVGDDYVKPDSNSFVSISGGTSVSKGLFAINAIYVGNNYRYVRSRLMKLPS